MPDVMKTVGRYEILREVGRGGMAMVYLARQTDLDRFVALKELGAFHASDPSFAQRFLRESRVAGSLSHPNICTVHDYFEHEGTPYIAMEYIERGSLRPYVGTMNLAQIGGVLEGLLAGLAHGEQHGIVHRDLKPENLMVTSDGRVKIADFGIAKATNQMQTGAFLTATGTTVGTPTYMAPEQAMAQDIGPPTDLYSVGCMAFEMFTGRVPFHDTEAPMAILLRHVNEQIPSVKSIDPKIDQDISDWIERMLVKDPTKRTQNANDAWDEFEEIIIGLLGPRWRREARLREGSAQFDTPAPLTPAPFQGTTSDAAVSDQFQSFAWGNAVTPDAPPGPDTPPPSDSAPLPPEPTVGPPTPPPGPAVAADGTAPDSEGGGFVTFGAPAAPEASEVAQDDAPAAEPEAPAVDDAAAAPTPAGRAAGGRGVRDLHRPRAAAPTDRRRPARGAGDPGARAGPRARRGRAAPAAAATTARACPGDAAAPGPGDAASGRAGDAAGPARRRQPCGHGHAVLGLAAPAGHRAGEAARGRDARREGAGRAEGEAVRQGRAHRLRHRRGAGGRDRLRGRWLRRHEGQRRRQADRRVLQRRRRGAVPEGLDQGLERAQDPRHDAVRADRDGAAGRQGRPERRRRPGQGRAPPTRRCCPRASWPRSASILARSRRARPCSSRAPSCRPTATRTCARTG